MSVNLEHFKDWEPYQKLVEILACEGVARFYFVATSCGMSSPGRTTAKLDAFVEKYRELMPVLRSIGIEHEEWTGKGKGKIVHTPALTGLVDSAERFASIWIEPTKIHSSGCGCSVFISDGQEVDVRVMPKTSLAYGDRFGGKDQ